MLLYGGHLHVLLNDFDRQLAESDDEDKRALDEALETEHRVISAADEAELAESRASMQIERSVSAERAGNWLKAPLFQVHVPMFVPLLVHRGSSRGCGGGNYGQECCTRCTEHRC